MAFFVWMFCRLFLFERFVLIVYLFLKNISWMLVLFWLMPIYRAEHALFLLWAFQRGLEQLIDWVNQNYLKQLYQRLGCLMGQAICDDFKYCLDVKCQYMARCCFCLWLGAQGTINEFISIVCLLTIDQFSKSGIKYFLGAFIYCSQPTFKASLVLWLLFR